MTDESLERALSFNEELAALSATGLPLDLGFDVDRPLALTLEKINSNLALQVRRGTPVDQVIAEQPDLPPRYRAALATWTRCDDSPAVLDGVVAPAQARHEFRSNVGHALIQPLIVLVLAYLALVFLCVQTAPKIEAIYTQLYQTPSRSLALLTAGREAMPIWGPLVPLLLLAAVLIWKRRSSRIKWRLLPGSLRYFEARRNASFADQMATLLESDFSLTEALALAGPVAGIDTRGSELHPREKELPGNRLAPDDPAVKSLPPILRWALTGDLDGEPMPNILRFAATTYRQQAERQATLWRIMTPAICGVLLGGMFVLGYGLSLFLPIIQLLKDLSLPAGV